MRITGALITIPQKMKKILEKEWQCGKLLTHNIYGEG